jgi:hypothetical protein
MLLCGADGRCAFLFPLPALFFLVIAPVETRLEWRGRRWTLLFGAASPIAAKMSTANKRHDSRRENPAHQNVLVGKWTNDTRFAASARALMNFF